MALIIIYNWGVEIMNVILYNNYSDNRTVSKQITPIKTISCNLKNNCNMKSPVIIVSRETLPNWINTNYAYLDTFKRYYYIKEINVMPADMLEIMLDVDVLMSFSSQIKGISCVIDRQEFLTNPYITDTELPVRSHRVVSYKKIGNLSSSHTIVLTVTGGKGETE